MKRHYLFITLAACLLPFLACRQQEKGKQDAAVKDYYTFYKSINDSLTAQPAKVRALTLQQMRNASDSIEWYQYAAIVLKTYFFTFDSDSVAYYFRLGKQYYERQPKKTPQLEDLVSEYYNIMGNYYARTGSLDTAAYFFQTAYEQRLRGIHTEDTPDILINLADIRSRQGQYDLGAYWYRRALLICDSLHLEDRKTSIFYGLGQIYMSLRDFELCDYYFEQAGKRFQQMLTYEQYIYLNNRGNSYYYREDYERAMSYFRQCCKLLGKYKELKFERNLCYLNMADVFQKMGEIDSSYIYLERCKSFFEDIHYNQALYYVATQELGLALKRQNLKEARQILLSTPTPPQLETDIKLIRYEYLQQYFEENGNFKEAYYIQQLKQQLSDSVKNERVKMRVADATLRYAQDSTLMAHNVLIQKKENEVLELRQTTIFWITLCFFTLLVIIFLYMYGKKKRALLQAQNRRTVSTLRLENIRNRLSPHFIFNVLNQEMANRNPEEQKELGELVKLMRRNLEVAEQLCVTLTEELDFVQTYINLERRSVGKDFYPEINLNKQVNPNNILIPSMLIQIPVENAVKHALRGKEGDKRLWININKTDKGISIRIIDNGGGFKTISQHKGTGTGMKVIMQTIQILNTRNKESIEVSIHNSTLPGGETGCEVAFILPDKYNYKI